MMCPTQSIFAFIILVGDNTVGLKREGMYGYE